MVEKVLEMVKVTEEVNINKDTVGSAFVKGATDSYIVCVLLGMTVHLGIKAYEHYNKK